jgi:hypothetical protein
MEHFGFIPDNPPKAPSPSQPTNYEESWLIARLEMILSGYRKADYHNLQMFMTQAIMNLMKFPREIIEYVSAPDTGIQTRSQWPPSLAEIVAACVAEQAWREKVARYSAMGPVVKRLPPPMHSGALGDGSPGTIYTAKAFQQAVEKHGRPFGPYENGREKIYDAK